MSGKLSNEQRNEIVEKYLTGKYNCASLGREYGVLKSSINRFLRSKNIPIIQKSETARKYTFKYDYFELINCARKAYWLGWMYSDGSNAEERRAVKLSIQIDDKEILEKLNFDLQSNYRILISKSKNIKRKDMCSITFISKKFSQDLAKLGCFKNKTFTLKFPTEHQLPTAYFKDFIRGMWDGDGTFSITKSKGKDKYKYKLRSVLVSTLDVCVGVQKYLSGELGINSSISIPNKKKSNTTRKLTISGNRQVFIFLNWMYGESDIGLLRKKTLYEYIIQELKSSGWELNKYKQYHRRLEYNGRNLLISEWSKINNISVSTIHHRLNAGWSIKDVLNIKVGYRGKHIEYMGKCMNIHGWELQTGIRAGTISSRLLKNWSIEKTLTTPTPTQIKNSLE